MGRLCNQGCDPGQVCNEGAIHGSQWGIPGRNEESGTGPHWGWLSLERDTEGRTSMPLLSLPIAETM